MSGQRILIVDDNAINAELVCYMLEAAGFVVETVSEALSALSILPGFQPELILMDIQLPGVNGLELTRQIKGDPATEHIVVVAFTAYAMKGDEARMRQAGCDGYIAKPIEVATFVQQVQSLMTIHS